MRQLLLELLPVEPPSLANFVPGSNAESLACFTGWLSGGAHARTTSLHLCGVRGSGKTHFIRASGFERIDARDDPALAAVGDSLHLAVDNVEHLDASGQIKLFNVFNHLRIAGGALLTAAEQPPSHLALREDLRTRLGSGLICRLHPLSDAEKRNALSRLAAQRAMKLPAEAIDYLMCHAPRDMRTLSALVAALDQRSLENKRPITMPLLRQVLQDLNP